MWRFFGAIALCFLALSSHVESEALSTKQIRELLLQNAIKDASQNKEQFVRGMTDDNNIDVLDDRKLQVMLMVGLDFRNSSKTLVILQYVQVGVIFSTSHPWFIFVNFNK